MVLIRAGRLKRVIQIRAQTAGIDASSPPDRDANAGTWSTVATVRGAVGPLRGAEFLGSGGIQAPTDVRIVIRYKSFPGLTTAHRLRVSNNDDPETFETFAIEALIDVNFEHESWEIMAKRGLEE